MTTYEKIDYRTFKRIESDSSREAIVTLEQLDGTITLLQQQLASYQAERTIVENLGVDGIEPVEEVIPE